MNIGKAIVKDSDDIAQAGTAEGRDDPYHPWQERDLTFALLVEQAFGGKPLLELFEGDLQRSDTARFDLVGDYLESAARFENVGAPMNHQRHPVAHLEAQPLMVAAEHHDIDRAAIVLESEIEMAGGGNARVGNLAHDPQPVEICLQRIADHADKLRHAERLRSPCSEAPLKLLVHDHATYHKSLDG